MIFLILLLIHVRKQVGPTTATDVALINMTPLKATHWHYLAFSTCHQVCMISPIT